MLLLVLAFALLFHPNDGSSLVHNVHKNLLLPANVGALGSHIAFNNSLQLAFRSHIGFSCYGQDVQKNLPCQPGRYIAFPNSWQVACQSRIGLSCCGLHVPRHHRGDDDAVNVHMQGIRNLLYNVTLHSKLWRYSCRFSYVRTSATELYYCMIYIQSTLIERISMLGCLGLLTVAKCSSPGLNIRFFLI